MGAKVTRDSLFYTQTRHRILSKLSLYFDEERERIAPLVLAAVSDTTEFDIDTYKL